MIMNTETEKVKRILINAIRDNRKIDDKLELQILEYCLKVNDKELYTLVEIYRRMIKDQKMREIQIAYA